MTDGTERQARKPINWWMVGCLASLLAFEVAREFAVINAGQPAEAAAIASVSHIGGFTTAEGQWKRLDSGPPLSPNVARIECVQERGDCIIANVSLSPPSQYVGPPDIERHQAQFSPDAITMTNADPTCVSIAYRIDLKLEKVFALREKKQEIPSNSSKLCGVLEPRVEMSLGNSYDSVRDPRTGHFVPLLHLLGLLLGGHCTAST